MALRHLSLRDFVIVRELELELAQGFTALTGETGAGKSILVDAVQLALGGRGDALWVREGADRCEISAEFDAPATLGPWLQDNGMDSGEPTLLLRRSIDAGGRSRGWINGARATMQQLRELGEMLVDIHGQHAWQSLTRPAAVRALLDAHAGADADGLLQAWQDWQQQLQALRDAHERQATLADRQQQLQWQIDQVEKLAPQSGEWEELNQRHTRLANAQALLAAAQAAQQALEAEDGSADALQALTEAQAQLQGQSRIEPEFDAVLEMLQGAEAQLREAARSLRSYCSRSDLDPESFDALDARVGHWHELARRLHVAPDALPEQLQRWQAELDALGAAADTARLQAQVDAARQHYDQAASAVSARRHEAAPRLADAVTAAMQQLGMEGGVFEVALQATREPTAHGLESPRLRVAAHAGTTPHDIDRVASGGELSRLALAIAVTTSARGAAGTLVFDEVDAGVGGAVADTVGRLLRELGQERQVLCVTHLAQVAACAHQHLHVSKDSRAGATESTVRPVAGEDRTHEIARMLGGSKISRTSLAHAREMLQEMPS
ncbi:MAG: DNA repair protein RecN [Ottowia sp.]|nr:DNA repair protein RecN [Ottowia sp.]